MSGAGNDFVVIDNRKGIISDGSALARKVCNRRWGIGADGLILLEPSQRASYRMIYYNADGTYGGMCGNGGRCIAYLAAANNLAPVEHSFEALDHVYNAKVDHESVTLTMKDPSDLKTDIMLRLGKTKLKLHFVDTGSPHAVIPIAQLRKKLSDINVLELGNRIRNHRRFKPHGTNVNFIERIDANVLKIRTYERGVEEETLACGTGSIAGAIVGRVIWNMTPPITVVPVSNVPLQVSFSANGKVIQAVKLTGPVVVTFIGKFDV
jgi:diaminopimelate epimerase